MSDFCLYKKTRNSDSLTSEFHSRCKNKIGYPEISLFDNGGWWHQRPRPLLCTNLSKKNGFKKNIRYLITFIIFAILCWPRKHFFRADHYITSLVWSISGQALSHFRSSLIWSKITLSRPVNYIVVVNYIIASGDLHCRVWCFTLTVQWKKT